MQTIPYGLYLEVTGPPVAKKKYTRIPMRDSIGARVTAYVHQNRVDYRPKDTTAYRRGERAKALAKTFDGVVVDGPKGPFVRVTF